MLILGAVIVNRKHSSLILASVLTLLQLGMSITSAKADEPICYMITPNGKTVDLTKSCSQPSSPKRAVDSNLNPPKLCESFELGRYISNGECTSGVQVPIVSDGYPDFGDLPASSTLNSQNQ